MKRKRLIIPVCILALLGLVALSTTAGQKGVPWPMPRYGAGQTGASPYAGLAAPWLVPVISEQEISREAGRSLEIKFLVDNLILIGKNGTVFLPAWLYEDGSGGLERFLVAIDPGQAHVLWTFPIFGPFEFEPAIGPDGTVYVYDTKGELVGLDPNTGAIVWKPPECKDVLPKEWAPYLCKGENISLSSSDINDILVGPQGKIYAQYRGFWAIFGPGPDHPVIGVTPMFEPCVNAHPAIGPDGTLYIMSFDLKRKDYTVRAIAATGREIWNAPVEPPTTADFKLEIVAGRGSVYAIVRKVGEAQRVIALDSNDGHTLWTRELGVFNPPFNIGAFELVNPPALGPDGLLYVVVPRDDGYWLNALDTEAAGELSWSRYIGAYEGRNPNPIPLLLTADGTLYVGGPKELLLLDARTGDRKSCPVPTRVYNMAMSDDGTIYGLGAALMGHPSPWAGKCQLGECLIKTVTNEPPHAVSLSTAIENCNNVEDNCGSISCNDMRTCDVIVTGSIEDPLGWNRVDVWYDFGDGQTYSEQISPGEFHMPHTYNVADLDSDTPSIKITTSAPGCPEFSTTAETTVCLAPPTIEANVYPQTAYAGITTVNFNCKKAEPPSCAADESLVYTWYFDDGDKKTGQNVDHVYSHSGVYTAVLTVSTEGSTSPSACQPFSVRVFPPPTLTVTAVPAGEQPPSGIKFDFACTVKDESGQTPSFTWSFGDGGEGSGGTTSHVYQTPGTYTASVTVTFPTGDKFAKNIQVCAEYPSIDELTAQPASANAGTPVEFSSSASGCPEEELQYLWDFNDGTTEEGANVTHVYNCVGTYAVKLTVSAGPLAVSKTVSITVNQPDYQVLTPRFTYPHRVFVGKVITLDASSSSCKLGEIKGYEWLITNEALDYQKSLTGRTVEWTPPCWGGTYTVKLTVTDECGVSSTTSDTIEVDLPPDEVCAGDILYHPPAYNDDETMLEALQGVTDPERHFDAINLITGHTAIVTCDGGVIEAVRSGVRRLDSVADFIHHYRHSTITTVLALRVTGVSASVRKKAVEFAEQQIGEKYDLKSILLGMKQLFGDEKFGGYYCSELVWAAYEVASGAKEGILIDDYGTVDLDPGDSPLLKAAKELLAPPTLLSNPVTPLDIYQSPKTEVIEQWDAATD